ncbi:aminotransferase class I/II-fold pyridoxal phosphate-dependent enzyme [Pelagicoccus sp. SDUM812003]|uniref:pyridoxal phosphate-dependent aminotransferase n=1 Tax=Pelagicoccus sp. SDUM812003 TaxID=3041267 RepID=UPI00280D5AA8|nr:aminotransferase class I/II-fold pyridoxal phosphate-dependent enzyme [Pelagicoccus sp. SDUM812003]MDQ8204056.1 aminotransferase class I/II-fold pyridoxal phosphate-dependent enzyme [Pelagicoccus sp. SDUM812003]
MKKMSQTVERRLRRWIAPAACLSLLSAGAFAIEAAPTLENSPIRLSSNENAFGYTPNAKEAMLEAIDSGSYYNRNNVAELVALCAKKEGVSADYILTTAGSGPLLMMTALAYAEPGANVVTTEMGYTQLVRKFEERGGDVKYAALSEDMGYDFEALGAAIDENTKIVYICNPNNPTGVLADSLELKKFVMSIPEDILVFVDEAYLELSDTNFSMATCSPLVKMRKNVMVTRTFSKSYGLAGFRIGYGIAHPDILEKISDFYMGPPSYLSAIAACEAIKDTEHLAMNVQNYKSVRNYVCESLDALGIEYAKPDGAFIYFKSGIDQQLLRDTMAENGVLISGSRVSGVPEQKYQQWARVSIGTKEQMDEFLSILGSLVAKT